MTDEAQPCLLERRNGRVLVLELNRPERLNALNGKLHAKLNGALAAAAADADVGAVILTGSGRAFSAGGDLSGGREHPEVPVTQESRADTLLQHANSARLLHQMLKPTIAMINGVAAGSGLALALACDLRFAAEDAKLTTAYLKVAMSGDLGVTHFLTQLVGTAKARELLFLNEKIDAREALQMGLVNRIAHPEQLLETTMACASNLANGPSIALRHMKRNLLIAENGSLDAVIESEAYGMARCGRTHDAKEAGVAFREKRAPIFRGI